MKTDKPEWIWLESSEKDQYVEFRRDFQIDALNKNAVLRVSADTNFAVFINGEFLGTGQFSDFPNEKTFSTFNVADKLARGKNTVAILAHYCGESHFSYIPGPPGLWYEMTIGSMVLGSGESTMARISPAYTNGRLERLTPQMGFTFEFDASKDDEWTSNNYECGSEWKSASKRPDIPQPVERPLKQCLLKKPTPFNIIAQGLLKRFETSEQRTIAATMQSDYLSSRRNHELFENDGVTVKPSKFSEADGFYVVIDMGREECGFVNLEIDAPEGSVVDIAVGEHLADLRVRAAIGGRNFASRYITAAGKQDFTHFINRYSGRYIQLHFTNVSSDIAIHYAGIIPFEYPLAMKGGFSSQDSLLNKIHDVSRRTLHLCMHEHYEDTPWREQALYANDSRNQALTGYYAFGEYDMPRVSFDLLSKTFRDDGFQELCAPMRFDFTIPSFTMTWFLAVRDHLLFSGDIEAAKKQLPKIKRMMDVYFDTLVDDLLPSPKGKRFWHFYDWADGLNGCDETHPAKNGLTGERFDAPLNMFFALATRAVAEILESLDETATANRFLKQAERTSSAIHKTFWVESEKLYQTYRGEQAINNHFAELTQSLAILANVSDKSNTRVLREKLARKNNDLVATTIAQSLYKFEAVLLDEDEFFGDVLEKIKTDWGGMLYGGATTFWETIKGQADFGDAGSLCHGWSAIPAYIFQRYLLGVKPLDPGFKKVRIAPIISAVDSVAGIVPTPHGNIEISWKKTGDEYQGKITCPEIIELTFQNENSNINWTVNKKERKV